MAAGIRQHSLRVVLEKMEYAWSALVVTVRWGSIVWLGLSRNRVPMFVVSLSFLLLLLWLLGEGVVVG